MPILKKPLGKTGIHVSRLCFGTLTIASCQAALPPEAGGAVIAAALDRGVNFLDTAQLYDNYASIAHALRMRPHAEPVIASKTYAYTARDAAAALEEARRALNRDVIDLFLLHEQEGIYTLQGHAEALDELYRWKAQGAVRAVGLSTHHVAGVYAAAEQQLDVVHPLLNKAGIGILDGSRADMERAVDAAANAGVGVYLMKALGGGHLCNDAADALRYACSIDAASSIAVGMQSELEVQANCTFFAKGAFDPREVENLRRHPRKLLIESWCEGCGTCVRHCPQAALWMDMEKKQVRADHAKCITCGYCGAYCPVFCLKII